jgi:hypothetical protein
MATAASSTPTLLLTALLLSRIEGRPTQEPALRPHRVAETIVQALD